MNINDEEIPNMPNILGGKAKLNGRLVGNHDDWRECEVTCSEGSSGNEPSTARQPTGPGPLITNSIIPLKH